MSIVTHNGAFHLDEVVAVGILNTLYPELEIIRTRDKTPIKNATFAVDIGQVYSHEKKRYDHHQPECNEVFNNSFETPLSSAGMVYKHYGKEYIKKVTGTDPSNELIEIIYVNIFEHIDGFDNGVYPYKKGVYPKFKLISLYDIILNSETFDEALKLTDTIIKHLVKGNVKRYNDMKNDMYILKNSKVIDDSIIVVEKEINDIKSMIHKFRKESRKNIVYVIYINNDNIDRITWSIRAVQTTGFEIIKPFPPEHYLKEKFDGIEFYHKKQFFISCSSKETSIEICKESLKY